MDCHLWCFQASLNVLVISQQRGLVYGKDSDRAGAETTGEDLLPRVEGYRAGAVLRHEIIQLNTRNKTFI